MIEAPHPSSVRNPTIDVLRGLTILWITAFHFYADTRGGSGRITVSMLTEAAARLDVSSLLDMAARILIALPAYRLDVFLAMSGLVLTLARPRSPIAFWRDRARAILPNYWCGTVAVAGLLVALALLRSGIRGTAWAAEISDGTLLARGFYHFQWADILRSLSVVGRLHDLRTMQVVAPSFWYVVLLMQLYLAFPLLRWLLDRLGSWLFVGVSLTAMGLVRYYVLSGGLVPGFGIQGTLIYFLPCRLIGPALGMAAAAWLRRGIPQPSRALSIGLLGPAILLVLGTLWYGSDSASRGVFGAAVPLVLGLPALWIISSGLLHAPGSSAALVIWIGRHSLSLLVVQDLMRLVTGTVIVLRGRLDPLTWYVLPLYLMAAVALTPLWHVVPETATAFAGWRRPRRAVTVTT